MLNSFKKVKEKEKNIVENRKLRLSENGGGDNELWRGRKDEIVEYRENKGVFVF